MIWVLKLAGMVEEGLAELLKAEGRAAAARCLAPIRARVAQLEEQAARAEGKPHKMLVRVRLDEARLLLQRAGGEG